MHADELDVSEELARRLLAAQCPDRASQKIRRVPSWGTVNAMLRVGGDAVMRMPLTPTSGHPDAEAAILDRLSGRLTARVPRVLHVGRPGEGYPRPWLLLEWIEGETATVGGGTRALADDLALLLRELSATPVDAARPAYRGGPLQPLDDAVRECLRQVRSLVDARSALAVWRDALAAPQWTRPPVWVHGDLLAGNVLVDGAGKLAAVIDWEAAGRGEPACDLMAAWSMLDAAGRDRLREISGVDDATWRRGRGWALAQAAIALPYYRDSNVAMADHSRHVVAELVAAA